MNLVTRTATLAAMIVAALQAAPGDDPCAEEEAARPGPAAGSYSITPAAESIRIPFEVHEGELRLIGQLGGKEVRILIDNGVLWNELLFFGSPRVDALELEPDGMIQVGGAGAGDPLQATMATGVDISFAGEDGRVIEFRDQSAVITPYDKAGGLSGFAAEGQISAALFRNFVVGFDFAKGIMSLDPPAAFDTTDKGVELHLKPMPGSVSWSIPGTLTLHDERTLQLDLAIDLGWDDPLAINFGGVHDIRVPEGLEKALIGHGAQGAIHGYIGTVPGLQIGGFSLSDVVATYSTIEDGGAKDDEVMVGLGTFARFHVHFDYQGHRLFLKPIG